MTPETLTLSQLKKLLLFPRKPDAHKGDFGHTLIIGGDYGMAGAVRIAAEAAARTGSGLTSVATRPEHVAIISGDRPEVMCLGVNHVTDLQNLMSRATVIVLGPGLGQSAWSQDLFHYIITATSQPKVIDADALNLLSKQFHFRENWILTPHVLEAARLLNSTPEQIQQDRIKSVIQIQKQYGGVAVLKGQGSLVVGKDEKPHICQAGNPGMASGGMGDALSGILGGLVAQNLNLQDAAELGVCVHSVAGDLAAREKGERGLLALDLIHHIQTLVN